MSRDGKFDYLDSHWLANFIFQFPMLGCIARMHWILPAGFHYFAQTNLNRFL